MLRIQQRLILLGYKVGNADGIWGHQSQLALNEFRVSRGLGITNQSDAEF